MQYPYSWSSWVELRMLNIGYSEQLSCFKCVRIYTNDLHIHICIYVCVLACVKIIMYLHVHTYVLRICTYIYMQICI